jgi:hypothetical protein
MDSGNLSVTQRVLVAVLNTNDPPSDIILPRGITVIENEKVIPLKYTPREGRIARSLD